MRCRLPCFCLHSECGRVLRKRKVRWKDELRIYPKVIVEVEVDKGGYRVEPRGDISLFLSSISSSIVKGTHLSSMPDNKMTYGTFDMPARDLMTQRERGYRG
jgi:hypothetical protein